MNEFEIAGRKVGENHPPLVVAEIGINHEGSLQKAIQMVDDAAKAGCECVKFQCHVIEDEMIPNNVIPGNASESIWDIMERCALTEAEDNYLKNYVESKGMIYMSTPFSRAAAFRLEEMGVEAYKIGSGECNNYPLIEAIASFGKPIILSTGMNDLDSIRPAVEILRKSGAGFALLHCTSIYPTPYNRIRLGAISELKREFPDAVVGLSDHSLTNYPCLGAVALGASILERHYTSDKSWPGPDIEVSMDPKDLKELIEGSRAIFESRGGRKEILEDEMATIKFAYASVVAITDIKAGDMLSEENIWVKRPGTGQIMAKSYPDLLGRRALVDIPKNQQLKWCQLDIENTVTEVA